MQWTKFLTVFSGCKTPSGKSFSKYIAVINSVLNVNAIFTEMNTKVASIQLSFSSRRTPKNFLILTKFLDSVVSILFICLQGLQNVFIVENFSTVA